MDTQDTVTVSCWHCGGVIASVDQFCRHCGRGQGKNVSWYYSHAGIIALTLTMLGPFSLRFVWKSPVLTKAAKWAYTAGILAFTWYVGSKLYGAWQTAISMLGGNLPY